MFNDLIGVELEEAKRILNDRSVSFSIIDNNTNAIGNVKLVVKVDGTKIYVENFLVDLKESL